MKTILEDKFYHDGRGPDLQRVVWGRRGAELVGFEYFNPDDDYERTNLKYLRLLGVEAYAMAGEEVHGAILASSSSKAAIFQIDPSNWLKSFNPRHLDDCHHYQVMFYDEIFDVICREVIAGNGPLTEENV